MAQSSSRMGRLACGLCVLMPVFAFADSDAEDAPGGRAATAIAGSAAVSASTVLVPTVASIAIVNDNIFDLDDPEEDKLLFRLANALHIKTKPEVISHQLLFEEGDLLSPYALEESERILRGNRYIHDASIEKSLNPDGTVDVEVHTSDVWTLMPRFSIARKGGVNTAKAGIKETNLFGTGRSVELSYESDIDRDLLTVGFADRNLGGSWYGLSTEYSLTSDGHAAFVDFGKRFYSLDATSANGLTLADSDLIDYFYDRGEIQSQFRHETSYAEVFFGWSAGLKDGWSKRYTAGVVVDRHSFSAAPDSPYPASPLPEDRSLTYPFFGIELVENKYEKTENVAQISRTEDHFLGTRFAARVGYASSAFGSDRDAFIVDALAQTTFGSIEHRWLTLEGGYRSRIEDGAFRNRMLEVRAGYFQRQSDHLLFFAGVAATAGSELDLDNQVLLGGDNGLRGYPLRYQSGEKRALLTLEQRLFTDWYPFRLFRVGGAVFFDAGKVWDSRYGEDEGLLRDVGIGLRLGNDRSGLGNLIHVDLAFPLDAAPGLDGVQLLVETRKSF